MMKKLVRVLLILLLGSLSFPIFAQATSEIETSIIPESNWIKLTDHSQGADSPAWSPDGSEIVYNTWDGEPLAAVYKMKADGSNRVNLGISRVQYPHVSPDGSKIVTVGFGYVWISNYDGSDHHHIYGVYDYGSGVPGSCHHYATWSPTGDKIAVPEFTQVGSDPHSHIITIDPDGANPTSLTNDDQTYLYPCWSPDGTQIAYQKTDHPTHKSDLWIMHADGQNQHRVTYFEDAMYPIWSPDGSSIFFIRNYDPNWAFGKTHIYRMNIDGTNVVQLTDSTGEWSPAISPDGKWIAFTAFDENGQRNIYKAELRREPTKWAVVIGISDYSRSDEKSRNVPGAVDSATDMYDLLVNHFNFDEARVHLRTDEMDNKEDTISRYDILSELHWLKENAEENDVVVFYFCGHGDRVFANNPEPEMIIPHSGFGIVDEELACHINDIQSEKILVIIASCHSGGFIYDNGVPSNLARDNPEDRIVLTACTEDELTIPRGVGWLRSREIFTLYFLEAFKDNNGDSNADSKVTIEEAFYYAHSKVLEARGNQHPQMYDGISEDLYLGD